MMLSTMTVINAIDNINNVLNNCNDKIAVILNDDETMVAAAAMLLAGCCHC